MDERDEGSGGTRRKRMGREDEGKGQEEDDRER